MNVDVKDAKTDLQKADRAFLQHLAKKYSIKANQKSVVLISELGSIFEDILSKSPQTSSGSTASNSTGDSDTISTTPPKKTVTFASKIADTFESIADSAARFSSTNSKSSVLTPSLAPVNLHASRYRKSLYDDSDDSSIESQGSAGKDAAEKACTEDYSDDSSVKSQSTPCKDAVRKIGSVHKPHHSHYDDSSVESLGAPYTSTARKMKANDNSLLDDSSIESQGTGLRHENSDGQIRNEVAAALDDSLDIEIPDLQEITQRLNQISLETVNPDGEPVAGEEVPRYVAAETLDEIAMEFGPGKLGFLLKKDVDGDSIVASVLENCPVRDFILPNDLLLRIDDFEARKAPITDVVTVLKRGHLDRRRIITFGRKTTKIPAPPQRKHGKSTSQAAANRRTNDADLDKVDTIPSILDSDGAVGHKEAAAERKQSKSSWRGPKMGQISGTYSGPKSSNSESMKKQVLQRFVKYQTMTTLTPKINGEDTSNVPSIQSFLVFADPFKNTDPNGGRRHVELKHILHEKTRVVIMANSEDRIGDAEELMRTLVRLDFNSDEKYEIIEATTVQECMQALNGSRATTTTRQDGSPERRVNSGTSTTAGLTPATYK